MLKLCWSARFLAFLLFATTCFGQNPDSPKFYKLDFVVKEVEAGKVLNARMYSMIVSSEKSSPSSSIRTGSRVPTPSSPGNTQFTYFELGVNIDCRSVQEVANELSLIVTADITSTLQESTATLPPVLRQNKWSSIVLVPIRKPLVVFSADDTTTRRQMQLELTATPMK
jgi:hypothetical protein